MILDLTTLRLNTNVLATVCHANAMVATVVKYQNVCTPLVVKPSVTGVMEYSSSVWVADMFARKATEWIAILVYAVPVRVS